MKAPDEIVADLAGAILDGTPIDWLSVEAQSNDACRELLEPLRVLAAVADVHRRAPAGAPESSDVVAANGANPAGLENWGPLRVLELVGHGTSGMVYRAWDTRLDREVALKLLSHPSVSERADATAVVHEGRLLARVRHPNVVTVYGAEQIENRIGLWMEFVRGDTLERALAAGKTFSAADAASIGVELCDALSAVHGAGLLHRDVKAHNVALAEDGRVVLMDFSAGREVDRPSSDLAGTPLYLAPEIFEGRQASVRSDIYSLGVLLYHLVTRSYPVPSRSLEEIRRKHERREHLPLRAIRPDLPKSFVDAIDRATRRNPERRYATAEAMKAALTQSIATARHSRFRWTRSLVGAAAVLAVASGGLRLFRSPDTTSVRGSEWTQITNFSDSVTSPALSADGRMVTFIRGASAFAGPGQIYAKRMPDGDPLQLTADSLNKMSPIFSPNGARIAYTTVDPLTFRWDTQVIAVQGTEPPQRIGNASGLTWIDDHRLLFSEIKNGIHMALVTGTAGRGDVRDIYVPEHHRGMVHRSALSPDHEWVLAAEMSNQAWLPCRLVPFDGRDRGRPVGPAGAPCTAAAWSRDGAWMYVNVNTDGNFHIWRQRFPDGVPMQVTSGPTEETGIAMAPDGRSLVTAVGITTSSVWVHDQRGERQTSFEGNGDLPGLGASDSMPRASYFSPDESTLYYLVRRSRGAARLDGELWAANLATGRSERLLPDFALASFDVSDDGKRVVFASAVTGKPRIWLASLDGRFQPRQLSHADDDHPLFASNDEIVFRSSAGGANFMYTMKEDGTDRRQIVPAPILALNGISPDGRWVVAYTPVSGEDVTLAAVAYPRDGGSPVRVCDQCKVSWSRNGRRWYLSVPWNNGRTYAIALREGESFPDLPATGVRSEKDLARLEILEVIDKPTVAPGNTADRYAFTTTTMQRNLYRVPLP